MIRASLCFLSLLAIGVALALMLGGCAAFETPVAAEYRRPIALVTWIETEDVKAECKNENALACAYFSGADCRIYTYPQPAWETLGHELGHCFLGHFHNRQKDDE